MTQKLIKRLRGFSFSYQYTRKALTSSAMAGKNPNPTLHQMMTLLRYGVSFQAYTVSLTHVDTATISTTSTSIYIPVLANTRRCVPHAFRRQRRQHGRQRRSHYGKQLLLRARLCSRRVWAAQIPESHLRQQNRFHWNWPTSRTQRCDTRVPCFALWILSTPPFHSFQVIFLSSLR